jgi:hypothetical protein
MLNVDVVVAVDIVAVPVNIEEENTPNFRIAFADSKSSAKSNPLIKFSFAIFILLLLFVIK